tara:strand:+ start:231 stop:908 length:678 start_codon:yes stop_codon:yes gene_type:complete
MIEKLFEPNMESYLFILAISSACIYYLDIKVILILIILFILCVDSQTIMGKLMEIKGGPKEKIIQNNQQFKRELSISPSIQTILQSLKKYKKYNPITFKEGYQYIKLFIFTINDLERDDISHPRQYFENAYVYLHKSINLFQSISISVPEEAYIHTLKYNKREPNKLSNEIGKLCKELYNECYYLLYNLSLRHNQDWFENPDRHKHEIQMGINESNHYESEYELY